MNFKYEDKIYSIVLNQAELTFLNSFVSVYNFNSLYNDYECYRESIKEEDFDLNNKNKKLHFSRLLERFIEEDEITDELAKKQFARGLILQRFIERKLVGTLKLNAMLMYELYSAMVDEIQSNNYIINEDISITHIDYSEKKAEQDKANADNVILKSLSNKIIQAVSLKDIYIIKLDYEVLSILEHKELCLK